MSGQWVTGINREKQVPRRRVYDKPNAAFFPRRHQRKNRCLSSPFAAKKKACLRLWLPETTTGALGGLWLLARPLFGNKDPSSKAPTPPLSTSSSLPRPCLIYPLNAFLSCIRGPLLAEISPRHSHTLVSHARHQTAMLTGF